MNYRERIRKAIECPQFGDSAYGEWGGLRPEQRKLIKRLLDEMDRSDEYIKNLYLENEKNKAIIKGIKESIKKYSFRNLACNPETDYYTGWNSALKEIEKTIKMLEENIGEGK